MVDLSEFQELSRLREACTLAVAIKEMKPDDQEMIEAALAEPTIGHTAIVTWAKRRGYKISEHQVRRHRSETCACA